MTQFSGGSHLKGNSFEYLAELPERAAFDDDLTTTAMHAVHEGNAHCRGIMNGINLEAWNPETDDFLPAEVRYCHSTVTEGKAAAKALFQERYGLHVKPGAPLLGMLGRLAPQKGVDVVLAALPALLPHPALGSLPHQKCSADEVLPGQSSCQLALLGSGYLSSCMALSRWYCMCLQ